MPSFPENQPGNPRSNPWEFLVDVFVQCSWTSRTGQVVGNMFHGLFCCSESCPGKAATFSLAVDQQENFFE